MIHTHSFLALVLVSGCWLLMWLVRECGEDGARWAKLLLVCGILGMQLLQGVMALLHTRQSLLLPILLVVCGGGFGWVLAVCLYRCLHLHSWKHLASWGRYLLIAGVLAVPQLLIWTFGQATGEQFLRGYFNWANIDDVYLWFYIKNMGLAAVLFVCGYLTAGRKHTAVAFPVLIIWLIAELVVFQPNVYDNNKLLYVAYLFMCGVGADYGAGLLRRIPRTSVKSVVWAVAIGLCTVSAVLTMAREWVSDYQLMSPEQLKVAAYVSEHTDPTDTILTNTRHNNAIAALTGRNILCGSSSYLYYHGLDYKGNQTAVEIMYQEPNLYPDIYSQFGVDYILVSSYERSSYEVDESAIAARFPLVYESGELRLYAVQS